MGFLKKLGKIIKAPIKVLEKVVSPVIKPVAKVIEKVASPVIKPVAKVIEKKGAILGLTPLAKPIVSAVNKVLPPQVTEAVNRIAPDVAKGNPIVGGVKIPMQSLTEKSKTNPIVKGPLVDGRALINKRIPRGLFNQAKGGTVKMAKGGSASSRADGIAQRGKTRGRMV